MVNVLEILYGVTAVASVVAIWLFISEWRGSAGPSARRRTARIFAAIAIVSGIIAALLYFLLRPRP